MPQKYPRARSLGPKPRYVFITVNVDPEFADQFNRFCLQYGGTRSRSPIARRALIEIMRKPPKDLAVRVPVALDNLDAREARGARGSR